MKTFILSLFIMILGINLTAQEIFPSTADNPEWIVCTRLSTYPVIKTFETISYDYDTVISQKLYHKVIASDSLTSNLIGFVRTSNNRVFLNKSGKDYLLYDFSLKTGDSVFCGYNLMTSNHPDTIKMKVMQVDSVECNLIKHKRITLNYNPFSDYLPQIIWIEGVGSLIHPLYPLLSLDIPGSISEIVSLKENDVTIFQSSSYTSVNYQKKNELIVFPNPCSEYVILQNIPNGEPIHVYLIDLKGNVLINKMIFSNRIDLSQIKKGIYLINVKTNTINRYEKLVKI